MWQIAFEPRGAARGAVEAARRAVGDRLLGASLYGSALTEDFHRSHSDVNVAFVFSALGVAELEALRGASRAWSRHRVVRPLLLTGDGIGRSTDTFPLEYLLIRERHENLHGADFFASLRIEPAALRAGVERALRILELGIGGSYVALAQTRGGARYWAARASTALAASASGLLYLAGESIPAGRSALSERSAARFGIDGAAMERLLMIRSRRGAPILATDLLGSALAVLSRLLHAADRLAVPTHSP